VYVLVQSALKGSKTGFALTTIALALAGSIVALRLLGVEGVPRVVTAVAVVVLVTWAVWTFVRARGSGLVIAGGAILLLALALYGENVVEALVRNDRRGVVNWADEHPGTVAGAISLGVGITLWLLFRQTKPRWQRVLGKGFAAASILPLAAGLTRPIDDFLDWLQSDAPKLVGWRDWLLDAAGRLEDHQALIVLSTLVVGAVLLNVMNRGFRAWARSL
jgi:hypothetical protein